MSSITIVGFGWVGQANALALSKLGHDVSWYDSGQPEIHYVDDYAPLTCVREVDRGAVCVVCVGEAQVADALKALPLDCRVVLRSTVPPDQIEKLYFDIYMPEFLHEKAAVAECINPRMVVLAARSAWLPRFVANWCNNADRVFMCSPIEASLLKYLSNTWNATKVAYVNEVGDCVTQVLGDAAKAVELVDFMFGDEPYMRYGKAYGGHCLPKDMRVFREVFPDTPLLEGVQESNARHSAFDADLPEVFSPWGK